MNYDKYIEAINEIEDVEQIIITEPRYRRCCYSVWKFAREFYNI